MTNFETLFAPGLLLGIVYPRSAFIYWALVALIWHLGIVVER